MTTWSPLRHWDVKPGKTVGIVGLGGLGHMAVKFARALGARVVLFTTSPEKLADALALGAHEAILSTDAEQMAGQASRFDFILDTVSSRHPLNPYLRSLKLDGTLCCLGIPKDLDFSPVLLTMGRRRLASSGVAGTLETQEMLDFCSQHNICADVEIMLPEAIDDGRIEVQRSETNWE